MKKVLLVILVVIAFILIEAIGSFLASIITMETIMNCVYVMMAIGLFILLKK